ncbi:hypothetical protein MVEN_01295400 [Mycena venus]|uniref:Uncharacterized protein n=1 Tax=Mycena venus TaxID=2733690 RepID=A0A8H7CTS1_9AGAR|nr:hypothetical protein MVEN_01295400 [Mycena venus]
MMRTFLTFGSNSQMRNSTSYSDFSLVLSRLQLTIRPDVEEEGAYAPNFDLTDGQKTPGTQLQIWNCTAGNTNQN